MDDDDKREVFKEVFFTEDEEMLKFVDEYWERVSFVTRLSEGSAEEGPEKWAVTILKGETIEEHSETESPPLAPKRPRFTLGRKVQEQLREKIKADESRKKNFSALLQEVEEEIEQEEAEEEDSELEESEEDEAQER